MASGDSLYVWGVLSMLLSPVLLNAGEMRLTAPAPQFNVDGSDLTNHTGYVIGHVCDTDPGFPDDTTLTTVDVPGDLDYTITGLPDVGSCYVAVVTISGSGQSTPTNTASKVMGFSSGLTVIDDAAYTIQRSPDRIELIQVGTVAIGTPCDEEQSVNGHHLVPYGDVSLPSGGYYPTVFALCQ